MSAADLGLGLSVFLACAVEAVEALTIVLAVGLTRSWRSTLQGAASALVVLAAATAALGPATAVWAAVGRELAGWRTIWTSSGVWDTAIFIKPGEGSLEHADGRVRHQARA